MDPVQLPTVDDLPPCLDSLLDDCLEEFGFPGSEGLVLQEEPSEDMLQSGSTDGSAAIGRLQSTGLHSTVGADFPEPDASNALGKLSATAGPHLRSPLEGDLAPGRAEAGPPSLHPSGPLNRPFRSSLQSNQSRLPSLNAVSDDDNDADQPLEAQHDPANRADGPFTANSVLDLCDAGFPFLRTREGKAGKRLFTCRETLLWTCKRRQILEESIKGVESWRGQEAQVHCRVASIAGTRRAMGAELRRMHARLQSGKEERTLMQAQLTSLQQQLDASGTAAKARGEPPPPKALKELLAREAQMQKHVACVNDKCRAMCAEVQRMQGSLQASRGACATLQAQMSGLQQQQQQQVGMDMGTCSPMQ